MAASTTITATFSEEMDALPLPRPHLLWAVADVSGTVSYSVMKTATFTNQVICPILLHTSDDYNRVKDVASNAMASDYH